VLVCRAPALAWSELEEDFVFLLRSVELEPQSVAPVLQGPLADRERQARRNEAARSPAPQVPQATTPSPKPKPKPVTSDPTVRIADEPPVHRETAAGQKH
jgi:hypothetical protein